MYAPDWPFKRKFAEKKSKGGSPDPDSLIPITPNMLLTGGCNEEVPIRDYTLTSRPIDRLL